MRMSDWSSDVCSSDLSNTSTPAGASIFLAIFSMRPFLINRSAAVSWPSLMMWALVISMSVSAVICAHVNAPQVYDRQSEGNMSDEQTHYGACNLCERSEEHTSELQSLMRISYAVFCL